MLRRDLLILGAFGPELAPLRPALGEGLDGQIAGLTVAARSTGIGLPAAAVGATLHLGDVAPRAVIMVGTCGAYAGTGLAIGDVVVARRVLLAEPSALAAQAEFPGPMVLVAEPDGGLTAGLVAAGGRPADVATTLAITVDGAIARLIAGSLGAQVEHLEAYGVAAASAARGVPFAAVLGVANFVGPAARSEWRAHHHDAAGGAVALVLRWLERDGPLT